MGTFNRRRLIATTGAVVGGIAVGGSPTSAASEDRRFLIDLREIAREDVPADVEIVHDISEIDVLSARGDPELVPESAAVVADVSVYQHGAGGTVGYADRDDRNDRNDGDRGGDRGPAKEHGRHGWPYFDDGEPTYTELQWDKRAQRLADLTDRPGRGRGRDDDAPPGTVHHVTRGEGSRVAVIDSGVYADHPDLEDVVNEELSANFTTDDGTFQPGGADDHGTHVAGIVAATNDNDGDRGGVLGTAPETDLVALRVFSGEEGASGDTLAALVYAAEVGCDAANLSLGYPVPYVYPDEYPELLEIAELYERAVEFAHEREMVVVNSAGNDGLDMSSEEVLSLPTEVPGVFGVSATGPIGFLWDDEPRVEEIALHPRKLREEPSQPAKYTNYGHGVDVSAAGGNYDPEALEEADDGDDDNPEWYYDLVFSTVYETAEDGTKSADYGWKAGTSMAAPQVTGAVALVRSLRPDASVEEVESLVRETARPADGGETYHGDGHLSLRRLVYRARGRHGRGRDRGDWDDDGDGRDWDDEHERDDDRDDGDGDDGDRDRDRRGGRGGDGDDGRR